MSEEKANFFSKIFFSYATPVFVESWRRRRTKDKSLRRELEEEDFWDLNKEDLVESVSAIFQSAYDGHQPKPKESDTKRLTKSIIAVSRPQLVKSGLLKLFNTTLQFSYPFLLKQLLFTLQPNSGANVVEAYYWALGLGIAMYIKALTENAYFWYAAKGGWRARQALSSAVYQKSIRLSMAARQTKTLGEIVNLMQLDATKIEAMFQTIHSVWDGLFQIIGYSLILFWIIGWSAFVGLAFMITMIPIQGFVMKKLIGIDRKAVKITDERVKKVNEGIQGILGVKMAAWEDPLTQSLAGVRDQEVGLLKKSIWYKAFSSAYMMSVPALTAVVALSVYAIVQKGTIDAATLFTALNTFGQLRFPLMLYPMALAQYAQATVSRKRIASFLSLEEVEFKAETIDPKEGSKKIIELDDVTVYWTDPSAPSMAAAPSQEKKKKLKNTTPLTSNPSEQKSITPALANISLSVNRGELLAIVGGVGQGKSALINTILKEMYLSSGRLSQIPGPFSFANQTPWILNATVRDNIVFGAEFEQEWYDRVLDSCQLRHDLSMLENYDLTEIGERGVSLSGGQKQRISTARAAYRSKGAIAVILDDPLSALDPEVGATLFEECILDLLKDQTRIVVTNSLDVLKECDRIVVIAGGDGIPGRISEQGTFESLMKDPNSSLATLMSRHRAPQEMDEPKKLKKMKSSSAPSQVFKRPELEKQKTIMQAEERSKGSVQGSVYSAYIVAGGGWFVFSLVYILFILSQGLTWFNTYWITIWTANVNLDGSYINYDLSYYLMVYALTAVFMAVSAFIRQGALMSMAVKSATELHRKLLISVFHAPMRFFDTTPTGRILQRFSQDIRSLDAETSENVSFFLFTTLFVLTSLGTIIYVTPIFAAFLLPMALFYFGALMVYRPVMRDAKRLGSIATSPVYAHFSETLGGVTSIRAFEANGDFLRQSSANLDRMTKMSMSLKLSERWLGIRIEYLGTSVSFIASMLCVSGVQNGFLTAGLAGLSLSYATSTTFLLTSTIRAFAQVEAGMNSVERVRYMGNEIPQEKWRSVLISSSIERKLTYNRDTDYESGMLDKVEDSWPRSGEIEIQNLTMKYREDTPLVLKNISFKILAGEKIGVAGRTGSGKSSLFLTLLRIVEPQPGSRVIIDGIDVSRINLKYLRGRISIAPQLPVLFSGTVRYNMDPFNAYSDLEIFDALEKVGLKGAIDALPLGLLAPVSEYGENFSQGERQLISLARAVLAKPKILLLDEASASLDADRDQLIQKTIHECFQTATMIVIAHRLETIIKSDRILVLGAGEVLEFDKPEVLLENPTSALSLAVQEMGEGQAERMKKQASSRNT